MSKSQAGVGISVKANSFEAAVEASKAAHLEAGGGPVSLAVVYTTAKHDPKQIRDGLRSVVGPKARIVGGYAAGVITGKTLSYNGYEVGILLLSSPTIDVHAFLEKGLNTDGELAVGERLGKAMRSIDYRGQPNILFMYDSVKKSPPPNPELYLATPMIEGMSKHMGAWPPVAGVGMMGDMQFSQTYQFFDDRVESHSALSLVLSGGVRMDTTIMHGCRPATSYHKITKAQGNVILEINGKPALDVVVEMMGPNSGKTIDEFPLFVTFGVNKGDRFGEFKEENYASRLVMAIDKASGALIMFESDLKAGDDIQLMRRAIDFGYIRTRAGEALNKLGGRKPLFAIYIDCIGRASAMAGTDGEEAAEVQAVIGTKMPLLGMYSGVEVAKVGNDIQALDLTGVLCVFSE